MRTWQQIISGILAARCPVMHQRLRKWWRMLRREPLDADRVTTAEYLRGLDAPDTLGETEATLAVVEFSNLNQVAAINEDWVLLLPPGSAIIEGALPRIRTQLAQDSQIKLWYCDHLQSEPGREELDLIAKPVWDALRLQVENYIACGFAIERGTLAELLDRQPEIVFEADVGGALLRLLAVELAPQQVLHCPVPLLKMSKTRRPDTITVTGSPASPEAVSVIVPTRDGLPHLASCVESVLREFERDGQDGSELLIVDNGSEDPSTLAYLAKFDREGSGPVRVLRDGRAFNFSALNNRAVESAANEVLLLLNDDVEAVADGWMNTMLATLQWRDVGAVGARLLYPDGRIQHAGIALGLGGVAGHPCRGMQTDDPRVTFYGGHVTHSVSAVTAACLMTRRSIYSALGGLDAEALAIAFNDVDFCLKLRRAGYRIAYQPAATLLHHESISRGAENTVAKQKRFAGEIHTMRKRWAEWMDNDPYYSPHWTLSQDDLRLRWPHAESLAMRPRSDYIHGLA